MGLDTFQPRRQPDIFLDLFLLIQLQNPELTDWSVGSRIRTLAEAFSIEMDEAYHQIVELLNLWNLENLVGIDLDERLAEFGLSRKPALAARGTLVARNGGLITSFLSSNISSGATSSQVLSSLGFPSTAAAPFTIRIGEELATVEDITVSANDFTSSTFTHAALTNNHSKGERVSLVTGGALTVAAGTLAQAPASDLTAQRIARLLQDATIAAGNYESAPVNAIMEQTGIEGNVAAGTINEFVSSPPFTGAEIENTGIWSGGRQVETDGEFLERARNHFRTLARATPQAIKFGLTGLEYTNTATGDSWRILSSQIRESFRSSQNDDRTTLYIWPGNFNFISSSSVTNEAVTTAPSHATDGQKYFKLDNIAILPNSLVLQKKPSGAASFSTLQEGTDYFLNEGTGWIEFADPGLDAGDEIKAASYSYYTGLIQEAQKTVNGSEEFALDYPGLAAAGVKVLVSYPRAAPLDPVRLSITAKEGFTEAELRLPVQNAIANYIQEIAIGGELILNELRARAMGVEGVRDIKVQSPVQNIPLQEDQVFDPSTIDILAS